MGISQAIIIGIATMYIGVVGSPLYCDNNGTVKYCNEGLPWVALPVDKYGEWAECGGEIVLYGDGWSILAQALDAGPLSEYYIEDFPELMIIADVPRIHSPFKGLSSKARMINVTRAKERMEKER